MSITNKATRVAYHFTGPKLRDGSPIPAIGQRLVFPGKPIMCEQGLHFSLHPFEALQYAPGPFLHRVSYGGIVKLDEDKGVCTERTILASIDATSLLREFACNEALRVLPANAPAIVRRYLITRDESLREEAWYAAGAAAWYAARAGAWCAAWGAARGAAWDKKRQKQRDKFLILVENAFKQ